MQRARLKPPAGVVLVDACQFLTWFDEVLLELMDPFGLVDASVFSDFEDNGEVLTINTLWQNAKPAQTWQVGGLASNSGRYCISKAAVRFTPPFEGKYRRRRRLT